MMSGNGNGNADARAADKERRRIKSADAMRDMMVKYYTEAKGAEGTDRHIAWITSGAPVEPLIAFDVIPVYPENHGAMCGASHMNVELCEVAEGRGFSRDLCSYARGDIGSAMTKGGPIGGLPRPTFLVGLQQHLQHRLQVVRGAGALLRRAPVHLRHALRPRRPAQAYRGLLPTADGGVHRFPGKSNRQALRRAAFRGCGRQVALRLRTVERRAGLQREASPRP